MKKILFLLVAFLLGSTMVGYAQTRGQVEAQMKEVRKRHKTEKQAKDEAKKREKQGWTVMEGSLPMASQFEENFTRQHMLDEDGDQMYYFGHGTYRTDDKNAAYKNACLVARQDIASQLETELVEAFNTDVRSQKMSSEESVTVSKAFAEGKAVVTAKLAGVRPLVRIYRRDKYQYEVEVEMFYSREKARELARDAIREKLANEESGLRNVVDDLMDKRLNK